MKRVLPLLFLAVFTPLRGAEDLDALIEEYRELRTRAVSEASRQKNAQAAARQLVPILRRIARLGTDPAMDFLLREVEQPPVPFGTECARAIATSAHPRAVELLLRDFSKRHPRVCRAILDALDRAVTQARKREEEWKKAVEERRKEEASAAKAARDGKKPRRRRPPPRRPPPGPDLKAAATVMLEEARKVKQRSLQVELVPLVALLESLEAARTILHLTPGEVSGNPELDEFRATAVLALASLGEVDGVRGWIARDAFRDAGTGAGKLAVVAETAGRLRVEGARPTLEKLLLNRSELVVASAFGALGALEAGIPEKAVRIAVAWLGRELPVPLRARILDSLARSGTARALAVVLHFARKGDTESRAIAQGSLALARENGEALEGILAGLRDPARDVRSTVLRALDGVRDRAVIGPLIDYLGREKEGRLRVDALKMLVRLTGHNMGLVAADWQKWWRHEKTRFEFPDEEAEFTQVRAHDLSYFGIEISSKKMAFLLDVSLSMLPIARSARGSAGKLRKIDLLKRELTAVVSKLSPDTLINIHTFDHVVRSWEKRLQRMSGGGRQRAIAYVKGLKTAGGTNIFDSIEIALRDPDIDTIYLLTDGQPTTGRYKTPPGILKGTRDINRTRGVIIHCIAFGAESPLLRDLAADHGGEYRFVDE